MSEGEAELVARLEGLLARVEQDARDIKAEATDSERQREEAARRGAMGPEWQRIQRRIDAGETSLEDVFSGRDDSPEARRLVGYSQANAERMGEQVPDELQQALDAADQQWQHVRDEGRR